jgi:hypothetical protein
MDQESGMADDTRRGTLELAVDLLSAAREMTQIASELRGDRAAKLRKWADRFTDRGLSWWSTIWSVRLPRAVGRAETPRGRPAGRRHHRGRTLDRIIRHLAAAGACRVAAREDVVRRGHWLVHADAQSRTAVALLDH